MNILSTFSQHVNSGLAFPRPTSSCSKCQDELVLRWGEKRKPHWAHLRPRTCASNVEEPRSKGESKIHNDAKCFLARYIDRLENKLDFQYTVTCGRCGRSGVSCLPFNIHSTQIEHRSTVGEKSIIWDIACLDERGSVIVGIEICHSHPVSEPRLRSLVCDHWVEFTASDVLQFLSSVDPDRPLLTDLRKDVAGNRCVDPSTCFTRRELAVHMKLLVKRPWYSCFAAKMLDAAEFKMYLDDDQLVWRAETDSHTLSKFEPYRHGRCLRCLDNDSVTPLCRSCVKEIETPVFYEEKAVSDVQHEHLCREFSWLDQVPEWHSVQDACFFCQRKYPIVDSDFIGMEDDQFTASVRPRVQWKRIMRRCCVICLSKKFDK